MNTLKENMAQLDALCVSAFGMSHGDMPDLTFVADLFEDGMSVEDVFGECCDNWAMDDPMFAAVMGLSDCY
jgi:hypothetical protein